MTTVFNAANEEAIKAFIRSEIKFLSIFDVVEEVLDNWDVHDIHSIEDVISADKMHESPPHLPSRGSNADSLYSCAYLCTDCRYSLP